MKIVIHNHLDESKQEIEGDYFTIERTLLHQYPHLARYYIPGKIMELIDAIDAMQTRSVEIVDDVKHPLLKVTDGTAQ